MSANIKIEKQATLHNQLKVLGHIGCHSVSIGCHTGVIVRVTVPGATDGEGMSD